MPMMMLGRFQCTCRFSEVLHLIGAATAVENHPPHCAREMTFCSLLISPGPRARGAQRGDRALYGGEELGSITERGDRGPRSSALRSPSV